MARPTSGGGAWRAPLALLALAGTASALDNGFKLPAMGYSSWNDCSSFRDNGPTGWCWDAEQHIRDVTEYLISSGLAKLGFIHVNVDEGWLAGRNATTGQMYEDLSKFPSGMKALGSWIRSQPTFAGSNDTMRYGLYSCRGTCQCGTGTYSAPGSNGHEADDTEWMVAAGAQYLKIDSCCGDQNHTVAFSDYAKWRDAMRVSGAKHGWEVWVSLCGWESWYSPPDPSVGYAGGSSLGNSWRIAGDGSGWGPLTNCMNVQAAAAPYVGAGGWADPDLLIGPEVYVGGQTDQQARAQFTMWSLFPTNLLISQNVLAWSAYALETYSNAELIAVNQDPLAAPAARIVGGDLPWPCHSGGPGELASVVAVPCDAGAPSQRWTYDAAAGTLASADPGFAGGLLDDAGCATADGSPVVLSQPGAPSSCGGRGTQWTWQPDGRIVSAAAPSSCLDVYNFNGPAVDVWGCNGGANQRFTLTAAGQLTTAPDARGGPVCLAVQPLAPGACTNVWGRTLAGGEWALGMVNNDARGPANVTCDSRCFAALLNGTGTQPSALVVRDLWAHADVATLTPPFAFTAAVNGSGAAAAFRLSPA